MTWTCAGEIYLREILMTLTKPYVPLNSLWGLKCLEMIASAKHDLNMCWRDLFKGDLDDTYTKPYVPLNSLWGLKCLAMTLWNDWRQSKKATRPLSNSLVTSGNAMRSILGPPIQPGALFYSIAVEITTRDTRPEETTTSWITKITVEWTPPRGRHLWHRSDPWSFKSPLLSVKGDKTCPPVLAGRIQHFLGTWKQLTHDPDILNAVRGCKIDFLLTPIQFTIPRTISFSVQESANHDVNAQISKFLEKGIIVHSSH